MLVLSRKPGETIRIGDNITVVLVDIRGNKARLGIDAPVNLSIHRGEIYELIKREGPQLEPPRETI